MMNTHTSDLNHNHSFGQEKKQPGEVRTLIVIVITAVMMVVEIGTGILFGSMALLADGLHMASHTAALTITVFAYIYARNHAHDERYSFGTGKVNALGGFSGAVLLAVFAMMMAVESVIRLFNPVAIAFNQAILVAVIGLVVNGLSMVILDHKAAHHHGPSHGHTPSHHHHDDEKGHAHPGHPDHNLRSAYLHVLADALTSLLAIVALLAAKYFDLHWMDPLMGIVGAALVSHWSFALLRTTSHVLLDRQASAPVCRRVIDSIEKNSNSRVIDLHLWSVGPGIHAAIVALSAEHPETPEAYKRLIPADLKLVHVTVEVIPVRTRSSHQKEEIMSAKKNSYVGG